jgi:GTP-binding protein
LHSLIPAVPVSAILTGAENRMPRQSEKQRIVPKLHRTAEAQSAVHPLHQAEFLTTAAEWDQLPAGGAPEIAFAGRSNAGKSSAINALTQRTRLAYVSKTPGRTQHINLFRLRSGALLADLPGYGYAKVPEAMRRHWQHFIAKYLAERTPLIGLLLVMDARHPLTELDWQMFGWFLPTGRPVHVLLTKCDKLGTEAQRRTLETVRRSLTEAYGDRSDQVGVQLFSATRRIGIAEAEVALASWLGPLAG